MNFLTRTGMNLFDLINIHENNFQNALDQIYGETNTNTFKDVLIKLRRDYSLSSNKKGKHTIRYILLNLREETLEFVLPNTFDKYCLSDDLYITSRCYPFEKKPFISNLAGRKTSKGNIKDILEITNGSAEFDTVRPYLTIESMIRETGELYFDIDSVASREAIKKYNSSLDQWECSNGFMINEENGFLSIASYETTTIFILNKLQKFSKISNRGQRESNLRYLKQCNINFEDPLKKVALQKLFVNSQVMLIYEAAGTGKTTLINYISNMMNQSKKLFLTKTHTALQNLERRIENPGLDSDFISIDSFTKTITLTDYDIVFVDECSIIDNRTMKRLLEKIDESTLLVLAGDIYQIESIDFGNWFYYAKDIIKTDDPIDAIEQMEIELNRLTEELTGREKKLAISSESVANIMRKTIQREQNRIRMLNQGLQNIAFGQVKSVRLVVNIRDTHAMLLDALSGKQEEYQDLFSDNRITFSEAIAKLYQRINPHIDMGQRTAQTIGEELLDYRNYLELEVEVFRGADGWLRAESGALSTGEAIGTGMSILLMVVQSWEEESRRIRGKDIVPCRLLFLDEAARLDGKSISTLFELCERLDMQLLIAAPENISPEKGTTYKLVRKIAGNQEQVHVVGLRGFGATE